MFLLFVDGRTDGLTLGVVKSLSRLKNILKAKSGRNSSEISALQTQYISLIILFSASKTFVMVFLVSNQVIDPT